MEALLGTTSAFTAPFTAAAADALPYVAALVAGVLAIAIGKRLLVKAYTMVVGIFR